MEGDVPGGGFGGEVGGGGAEAEAAAWIVSDELGGCEVLWEGITVRGILQT